MRITAAILALLLAAGAEAGEVGAYPNASALNGTERMLSDQGGATANVTPNQIETYFCTVLAICSFPANTVLDSVAGGAPSSLAPLTIEQNALASASILRARDFGILPTNTATQNDTGFALMKTKMQSSASTVWRVIFEPGTIQYTNNRWLWGVNNVIIDGGGVNFQCTDADGQYANTIPLNVGDFLYTSGDVPWPGTGSYQNGYLISTAAVGAVNVITPTAGNAGNFSPGQKVIVYGYDQQGTNSYPPNLRYFEYNTVLAASTTAIATLGAIIGGNYTGNGGGHTYTAVPLTTSGAGTGAIATIVVARSTVTSVTITTPGTGYAVSDTVSATTANLGGAGTGGLSVPVASLGVVTLTAPLENFYDSRWEDTTFAGLGSLGFGAPRILPLGTGGATFPNFIWIKDANFLQNPNTTGGLNELQVTGNLVTYDHVSAISFNAVMSNKVIISRSNFVGWVSNADKLIDSLSMDNDNLNPLPNTSGIAFNDAQGLNNLNVTHSKFYGDWVQICPRQMMLDDVEITPNTVPYSTITSCGSGNPPIRSVSVKNTRAFNTGQSYVFSNQVSPGFAITAGTGSGSGVISLTYSQTVANEVEYGQTLTDTTTGISGIVTAIYYSGGNLIIDGTWGTVTSGDTINGYDVLNISDGGGNVVIGTQIPFWRGPPGPSTTSSVANLPKPRSRVFSGCSSSSNRASLSRRSRRNRCASDLPDFVRPNFP